MSANFRRMHGLLGLALIAVSSFGFASCGGDEDEAPGLFSEPCSSGKNACASGLMCVAGLCTAACGNDGACLPLSKTAICDLYCYEPCDTNQCPAGLTCTNFISTKRTCRLRQ